MQKVVTLSSTEAEYLALSDVARDIVYLRQLKAMLLGEATLETVLVWEDNQPCINLATDATLTTRLSRHVQVRFYYIQQCVEDGTMHIKFCPTQDMVADVLTKPVARPRYQVLRNRMLGY